MHKHVLHIRNVVLNSRPYYKLSLIFLLIIGQVSYSFSQDSTAAKCVSYITLTAKYRINNEIAYNLLEGFHYYLGAPVDDVTNDITVWSDDSITFYFNGLAIIYTTYSDPDYIAIKTIDTNLYLIEDTVIYYYNLDCPQWTQTITGSIDRSITTLIFETFFLSQFKINIHRRSDFGIDLPVQTHISYAIENYILSGGLIESPMPEYPPYDFEVYNLNGQLINSGTFDFKQKPTAIKKIENELPIPGIFVIRIFGAAYNERIKVIRF